MRRAVLVLALIGSFGIVVQGEEAQESKAEVQEAETEVQEAVPEPAPIDLDEILNNPLSESRLPGAAERACGFAPSMTWKSSMTHSCCSTVAAGNCG